MELIEVVMVQTYLLFRMPFTILGVTLSFFDVMMWACIGSAAIWFIWRIFNGD